MRKMVADRRRGDANIEGNSPDWQRPFVSPTKKNQSQKNPSQQPIIPGGAGSQLVHLNRAVQPRVHRPLHTHTIKLHIRIKLL